MTEQTRDPSGRWVKGKTGNPRGRPPAKSRQLLDAKGPGLVAKMIELAERGDVQALTWCCNRVVPSLKPVSSPVTVTLPPGTLAERGEHILLEMASGRLSADEAATLINALGVQFRLKEISELIPMLERIEQERKP